MKRKKLFGQPNTIQNVVAQIDVNSERSHKPITKILRHTNSILYLVRDRTFALNNCRCLCSTIREKGGQFCRLITQVKKFSRLKIAGLNYWLGN